MPANPATTFDDLEARTHSALAATSRVRLAMGGAHIYLRTALRTFLLAIRLRLLLNRLFHPDLDALAAKELREITDELNEMHTKLNNLIWGAKQKGLVRMWLFRPLFVDLQHSSDRIGDVLESCYLSLNEEFRQTVNDAIKLLNKKKDPADWRSSLAKMQD